MSGCNANVKSRNANVGGCINDVEQCNTNVSSCSVNVEDCIRNVGRCSEYAGVCISDVSDVINPAFEQPDTAQNACYAERKFGRAQVGMSIDDERQELESVTEGDRALRLFVNRVGFTRRLAEQLNGERTAQILYFYGDGGNGKSLLLKYLRQRVCKRFLPHVWQFQRIKR